LKVILYNYVTIIS